MLVLKLLKYVGSGSVDGGSIEVADAIAAADDREFRWAIDAGLGPLLFRAARTSRERIPETRRAILLSADLTAQVLDGCRVDAMMEIIDACAQVGAPVTLLKGISTSDELYPARHLRGMGDIDVLVPLSSFAAVEESVMRRGFQRGPDKASEMLQHGVPLIHPKLRVWLEIHRALFPENAGLRSGRAFGNENVWAQTVPSLYVGQPVRRLSQEMQLAYIASYWMWDLTIQGIHPGFLLTLFDAVHLLRRSNGATRWTSVCEWLDNDIARASLHVMLSYIASRVGQVVPVSQEPASRQWHVGRLQLKAIHAMLDSNLLGGRMWRLPLPPPVPGRYNLERQVKKRLRLQRPEPFDW